MLKAVSREVKVGARFRAARRADLEVLGFIGAPLRWPGTTQQWRGEGGDG
ncbi:hypothetical protein COLO4_09276 [Corchorus olitorius]|uniref:Uncharacterized protein n=1 Tax=Corchorus olitorius TaxID=93759 RepID=A0A1R3KCL0_9ROSI|nr:hypothetical protein COLO4_09276 [Corchorus olitorius]